MGWHGGGPDVLLTDLCVGTRTFLLPSQCKAYRLLCPSLNLPSPAELKVTSAEVLALGPPARKPEQSGETSSLGARTRRWEGSPGPQQALGGSWSPHPGAFESTRTRERSTCVKWEELSESKGG